MSNKKISLYNIYNGVMLGYFVAGLCYKAFESEYPRLKRRIERFAENELLFNVKLPEKHEDYINSAADIATNINTGLSIFSSEVSRFSAIGAVFLHFIIQASFGSSGAKLSKDRLIELLGSCDISFKDTDCYKLSANEENKILFHDLHTSALKFLEMIISKVEVDGKSAFVAMPFIQPFEDRYDEFYKPLLIELGYQPFRAWGGFTTEIYQNLLIRLIGGSSIILAELSGLNDNVIYEVGVAHGMGKLVFPICEAISDLPSNLQHIGLSKYDLDKIGSKPYIEQFALVFKLQNSARDVIVSREPEQYT